MTYYLKFDEGVFSDACPKIMVEKHVYQHTDHK